MGSKLKLLEQIILNVPNYIFWKDKNCIYRGCNKNFAHSLGFSDVQDIIGKSDDDMPWGHESTLVYRNEDRQILTTGQAILGKEVRMSFVSTTKKPRILSVSKVPLYSPDGKIDGILGIYIDITLMKKNEVALLRAKEKAEAANEAKSDFISNMEHDLKTPFSGIGGIASLLHSKETDPEKKVLLELMLKSCHQWEEVHHRIFDVLVVEQPLALHVESVSIMEELMKVEEMMAATVHMKGLTFKIEQCSKDIKPIKTDRIKFNLILSSLIGNAINFTEQGSVTVTVTRKRDIYIIQVIDTGIGIPAKKLGYVFEKFAKLSRSNKYGSNFKGVGLGLYTSKMYAKQLGAIIRVESELGKGSVFTFEFPRVLKLKQ